MTTTMTMTEGAPDAPPRFACRVARTDHEREAYFALRRAIFCDEQALFPSSDRDASDLIAVPIVCMAEESDGTEHVVGVVRIWEEAPGDWWGGRLGVEARFRTVGAIGKWLIQTAVGSARAWGAWRFRATVQRPNVPLFRRLHWHSRGELELLGQPHHLMEASLERYPLTDERRPVAASVDTAVDVPAVVAIVEEEGARDAA
jgi:putative N-acetyltransferase (TIGR04045 family)